MKGWARHAGVLLPRFAWGPALPYWLLVAFWRRRGDLRGDHVTMAVAATVLTNGNRRMKRLFVGLVPLSLVAVLYDAMRLSRNAGLVPSKVHVADIREKELKWFGVGSGASRVTLQDWFYEHASLPLDLFCAIPYGIFLYVVTGYAVFLLGRDREAQQRFAWGFFVLNVAGFVTYHLYPAAPPWYFRKHGANVHLDAAPSEGTHLARVDEFLGYPYFKFYERGSDVFGAVPSLHVAYPLLMILVGWRLHGPVGRSLLALFYGSMCFSAVYLDHHWVIDVLLGSGYALGTGVFMRRLIPVKRRRTLYFIAKAAKTAKILDYEPDGVEPTQISLAAWRLGGPGDQKRSSTAPTRWPRLRRSPGPRWLR